MSFRYVWLIWSSAFLLPWGVVWLGATRFSRNDVATEPRDGALRTLRAVIRGGATTPGSSCFDWDLVARNAELVRFVRSVIGFRKRHQVLRAERFYRDDEIRWLGTSGAAPDWNSQAGPLGCVITGSADDAALCLLFNAGVAKAAYSLPPPPAGGMWRVAIDTAADSPGDVADPDAEREIPAADARVVAPRSLAVLVGDPNTR